MRRLLILVALVWALPAFAQYSPNPDTRPKAGLIALINKVQTWLALQSFGPVNGSDDVQAGTTYTFVAADCGKTVVFTSNSAVTATIPASIVPASGASCQINVLQAGTAKVSVNGTAVSAATLISAHSYTGTNTTQGSMITLHLTTVSAATNAYLAGDGS